MTSRDELASKYFKCTKRERAAFEAGIKLGTIYHQFVGTPISSSNVESLERAIEDGVRVQPFVEEVSVRIDRKGLRKKRNEYDYQTLTGQMLEVSVVIRIDEVKVIAEMKYIEELNYPLMFIKEIIETL
ncbi:MAG: dihydroneopterin aldolase family protein [Methanomassiliicoccales archaeon]|nr:dihydroneopterin aldolase family protein [Methanomassiliicoccales archaeon]